MVGYLILQPVWVSQELLQFVYRAIVTTRSLEDNDTKTKTHIVSINAIDESDGWVNVSIDVHRVV